MGSERLGRKDYYTILVCVLIFAVSLVIGISYFDNAFPESTIDFKFNRQETQPIAENYLQSINLIPPQDYRHASIFSYSGRAKVYLEKELGLDSAQQYFGNPVRLWHWNHRWFKPSTKEEFRVEVSPKGEIVGFSHLIDEDAIGAELPEDSAKFLSDEFIFNGMGVDPESVELLEASENGRPNRADWYFTYKKKDFEPLPGSNYRYRVTILGDEVGGYSEFLHVPEAWSDDYSKLRSLNNLAGTIATFFMFLTVIAVVYVFITKIRHKEIHWKTAIFFGAVAAVLVYLNQLNSLPNTLYGYNTTDSWSGFLTQQLGVGLLLALGSGVLIAFLTASAEAIFREKLPNMPSLPTMFTIKGLRTKRSFINIIVGVTMTGFFFAYQAVFYMVSSKFGAWSPADVPYSNLLNTAMPWVAVLMIGFMPAVSEEFLSRMFSIPFLQKLFRGKFLWLAVFIPSIIWGFGHAGYPNQPFWIRGAEVGIAGLIVSVIFLRFGILGPLVWHYTVDALYTAFLLFRSDNIYFIITAGVGASLLVVPLIILLIAYLKTGRFTSEEGLLNKDIVAEKDSDSISTYPEEIEKPITQISYEKKPIPNGIKIALVVILVLGFFIAPTHRLGDYMEYPVTKQQAIATFSDSLLSSGWANPDTMLIDGYAGGNGGRYGASSHAYVLKELNSIEKFNDLYSNTLGSGTWAVRAWTHGNRLRFAATIDAQSGDIQGINVLMPEKMAGDSLSKDSAKVLIEETFARIGIDLKTLVLESHWEDNRPNRLDHFFVYEAPAGDERHIGEALFRYTGSITGSYVSVHKYPYYKVPEEWTRERRSTTGFKMVHLILVVLSIAGFIAFGITILILRARKNLVPWKTAALWAIPLSLVGLLSIPNQLYSLNRNYFSNPVLEWNVFFTTMTVGNLIGLIFMYLFAFMAFALVFTLYPQKKDELLRSAPSGMKLDIVFTFIGTIGLMTLLKNGTGWLSMTLPSWIPFSGFGVPGWLGTPFIAGNLLASLASGMVVGVSFLVIAGYLWERVRMPGLRILLLLGMALFFQGTGGGDPKEWLFVLIKSSAFIAIIWFLMTYVVRGRPLILVTAVFVYNFFPDFMQSLFGLENTTAMVQGIIYSVVAVILYFAFLFFLEKKVKTD